jgi:hypothetical protein
MANRRFDSIGTILSRTSEGNPPVASDQENLEVAATDPAPLGVTELPPMTSRRSTRPQSSVSPPRLATGASAKSAGGVRRIAFRLDPALHAALTGRAADSKTSQGQVVLDCVEAAHTAGVLGELVTTEAAPTPNGPLPPSSGAAAPPGRRSRSEVRLHAGAAAVLDDLVEQAGADSRTQLITAALRYHLG